MADENRRQNGKPGQGNVGEDGKQVRGAATTAGQAGDPGRTPGTAEGDEQTVDQDIEQKLGGQS